MADSTNKDLAKPEFINLNVHKAGLDGLDKERINQIIQEASKGSNFYRRQKRINEQIERLKKRAASFTDVQRQQAIKKADMIIVDLEQRRVLNKIIVHFDMDMFFAAVEIKNDPSLADIPMAVGSLSMISTSNYIARRFGVRSAMAGFIAKKLCPQLKLIKPNFKNYAKESEFVMNIISEYDPNIRTFSLDEVYIDLTEHVFEHYSSKNNIPIEDLYCMDELSDDIWQFANEVVEEIRAKVHKESQLTISAGIACNTRLAKVCTDINKPNGQFMVKGRRQEIMDFVSQIQIRKFCGIGPVKDQILSAFNIVKPTDIYNERALLSLLFGDIDYYLRIHLGIGSTHLSGDDESAQKKSHSRERTVGEIGNFDDICQLLKDISSKLSRDLKKEQQLCKTITLKLKKINFDVFIKCKTIDHFTDDEQILFRVGKELLSQEMTKSPNNKYRLIGLRVSNLCNSNVILPSDQLTLSQFLQTSTKRKESELNYSDSEEALNENGEYECNLCENTFKKRFKFKYHRQFCRGNNCDSIYGLSTDSDDDDDDDDDDEDDCEYDDDSNSNKKDDDNLKLWKTTIEQRQNF
ncbi:DNA polymerase kappa-like protein [Euroglyphus maynei]|uniref:DNA polymerase kappa n=1 Tax=Euroglyphus maynei TaxID=6958 RepID=A0A1Y3BC15_EURMA|nr:DNA polymerase kappa-like protein [Euroglyphus maynei]